MSGIRPSILTVGLLWAGATVSAAPILTLSPSGDLSGPPGSTVGWGFTIENDTDYIEITSAQFCVNPVNFPTVCNAPSTGTFTDFISSFNDIIVGPPPDSTVVSQSFDALADTGIGSFAVDPGASSGDNDIGQIVLTYNLTDLDPNNPDATLLGTDLVLSANASVTVTAPATTTPEPATTGMMILAVGAMWLVRCIATT